MNYLIGQRPGLQGYCGIKALCNHVVFKKPVTAVKYMPIDILMKENIDFYLSLNNPAYIRKTINHNPTIIIKIIFKMKALNKQTAPKSVAPERIIQFGEGNFLRAFVDWIVYNMNQKTDFNGSVVVVQPIEKEWRNG